ncbi:glycoside hydrolase family 28 protein [Vibrio maritimus]
MKRSFLIFSIAAAMASSSCFAVQSEGDNNYQGSWAQVPVILGNITVPTFQDYQIKVTDDLYGAIADGKTDARESIQRAIRDVSRYGGGKVVIPSGKFLVDGPIFLENNVNFHLEEGAEILFSTNYDSYLPQVLTRYEGVDLYNFAPAIYAYQKKNVAITGSGTLNGQAEKSWSTWVQKAKDESLKRVSGSPKNDAETKLRAQNNALAPLWERKYEEADLLRPAFIMLYDSENILLEGVDIIDAPFWVNHFYMSNNITVRNITMHSMNKNNDGIDIEASSNVHIHDVVFATGDDAIAIKSGRDLDGLKKRIPTTNVVVQNVKFLADDAVALGSEASGGVRNIFIENAVAKDLRKGFYFKTNKNRGAQYEHIRVRNMSIEDLADVPENSKKLTMLEITTNYDHKNIVYNRDPIYKDIRFENITGGWSIRPMLLEGTETTPIKDFVFDNVSFAIGEKSSEINDVDFDSVYFRNFNVGEEPLTAKVDGESSETVIKQSTNIPPDVYAGEDQILDLNVSDTISLSGNVFDKDGDDFDLKWTVIPDDVDKYPTGEDENNKTTYFKYGDPKNVEFSSQNKLSTEVTFKAPGIYRIKLVANDGQGVGYHTVYVDVRS